MSVSCFMSVVDLSGLCMSVSCVSVVRSLYVCQLYVCCQVSVCLSVVDCQLLSVGQLFWHSRCIPPTCKHIQLEPRLQSRRLLDKRFIDDLHICESAWKSV